MFTCKNCGGNVKFDIKSGQLACEYCHSFFDPYDYDDKPLTQKSKRASKQLSSPALSVEAKSLVQMIPQPAFAASAVHLLYFTVVFKKSKSRPTSFHFKKQRRIVSRPIQAICKRRFLCQMS